MDITALERARRKSVEVLCCYARKDQSLLLELKTHLTPLQREGIITLWADIDIHAGMEWEKEIHRHLNTAQIILLLISPDFLASEYCYSIEMHHALERHERGETRVIPIILRAVSWQKTPLGKLQALPTNAHPITSGKWHHQDEAFYEVVEGIRDAVAVCLSEEKHIRIVVEAEQVSKTQEEMLPVARREQARRIKEEGQHSPSELPGLLSSPSIAPQQPATPTEKEEKPPHLSLTFLLNALFHVLSPENKHYKDALAACEQALRLEPTSVTAYNNQSIALLGLGRYDEALAVCEQAIRLDPNSATAYSNKGLALLGLERSTEALVACERAILLDPNSVEAYSNKALSLTQLGRSAEALVACEQALRLEPNDATLHMLKGMVLVAEEHPDEALVIFEQALRLEPDDATLYMFKGTLLSEELQQYEEALEAYEQAIRLDPNFGEAHKGKSSVLQELKRYEEALAAVEQALRLDPGNADFYNRKGDLFRELKHDEESLAAYEQTLRLEPNHALASLHKRELLSAKKRVKRFFSKRRTGIALILVLLVLGSAGGLYAIVGRIFTTAPAKPGTSMTTSQPVVVNGMVYIFSAHEHSDTGQVYALDATTGVKKWTYHTGGDGSSLPTVVDGVVYISSYVGQDSTVYALDATTGVKKWAYQTGNAGDLTVVNGVLYFTLDQGQVYALDATTGVKKWVYQMGSFPTSQPVVINGVLYVSRGDSTMDAGDGTVYALDASSGTKKWEYRIGKNWGNSFAVSNGTLYVSSDDLPGFVYALDVTTGVKKFFLEVGDDSLPPFTLVDGVLYVGAYKAQEYQVDALDATTGVTKWTYQTGANNRLVAVNGILYVTCNPVDSQGHFSFGEVYALDATIGAREWRYQTGSDYLSGPVVLDGVVYVSSYVGQVSTVYALDATSGIKKWAYQTGSDYLSGPVVLDGVVYVSSSDGGVYALDAASGVKKWIYRTGSALSSLGNANWVVY